MATSESQSPSAVAAGSKRKRATPLKFYAVRAGHKPGIYHSYEDCVAQIKGFKNGQFKSFESLTEAQRFVEVGPEASTRFTSKTQKFYAVRRGHKPGVYTDWPTAQLQIDNFPKSLHKSFPTMAHAQAYVDGIDHPGNGEKASKKQRTASTFEIDESIEPGTGPMPPVSEDGFDSRILLNPESGKIEYKNEAQQSATRMQPVGLVEGGWLTIHTDGSALGNGKAGSYAGVGVYFGPRDPRYGHGVAVGPDFGTDIENRNASEPLKGSRQTNQRAELTAIQRAIEIAPKDRHIKIVSDSKYAINCVTEWAPRWRSNGWKTAAGKAVENKDLVETLLNRLDARYRLKSKTEFEWVKGHNNDPGNVGADELAVAAAMIAKEEGMAGVSEKEVQDPDTEALADELEF